MTDKKHYKNNLTPFYMKQIYFLCAVIMMAFTMPNVAIAYDFSAVAPTGQTLYYNVNGENATVTFPTTIYNAGMLQGSWNGYATPTGYLTIPENVEHSGTVYSVTAIDERAFAGCSGLITVLVPNTVTSIGDMAFSYVNNVVYSGSATGSPWNAKTVNGYLENGFVFTDQTKTVLTGYYGTSTTVTIPSTVNSIGKDAFRGNVVMTAVSIPNSVTNIGNTSFYGCNSLTSVSIANSVTSIGSSAFAYCTGLASLTIPNSVISIGYGAFDRIANIVYNGSATGSPWGAKTVNGYLENGFVYSDATKTTLTAYSGTAPVIVIPGTVTSIGNKAFLGCSNITSVSIPNTVTNIGSQSFYQCTGISEITIPESVITIGDNAFAYCTGITTVHFNATNCTSMGSSLYSCAFNKCNNLSTVTFGDNVHNIPNYAFYGCSSVTSITLNESVESIGVCAFSGFSNIITLSVPNSVMSIGYNAFYGIRNVSYQGSASGSPWGAYCINAYFEGDFMYTNVSKTVLMGYTGTDTTVSVPGTVINIGENAFRNSNIVAVTLPSTISIIGDYAFCQSKLRNISLPSALCEIGNGAFQQCSLLSSIVIPNAVYFMGNYAFKDCSSLETAYIGSSVSTIADETFSNCTNLHFTSLPQNLQSIGNSAFANCYRLAELNVPSSVTQIGMQAFEYVRNIIYYGSAAEDCYMDLCYWGARCKNGYFYDSVYYSDATMHNLMSVHPLAKSIVISGETQSVGNYAFFHCDVQNITYPSSVTSLGDQIYDGSTELRHLYCEGTMPPNMSSFYDPYTFDYDSVTVHVPCGSLLNYTGSWHMFKHIVEAEAEYTITVSSSDANAGTASVLLSPSCTSNEAVVMARPNDGYYFSMWNDSVSSNPRYIILDSDVDLVAFFTTVSPAPDTIHVHDTTYINIHDTTIVTDTVTLTVHDTTILIDTVTMTEYVPVHDTTYIDVFVHDTTVVTDTVTLIQFDTITNTVYDTVDNYIYDTLLLTDTIWLHDTIVIHDTIYITEEGIDGVDALNAKIYQRNGQVVVEGAEDNTVTLYDVNGRVLATKHDNDIPLSFDVPATGTYMIKIGNHPARKVVVIR